MRTNQSCLRYFPWLAIAALLVPMAGCRSTSGLASVPGFGWLASRDDPYDRDGWASYADGPTSLASTSEPKSTDTGGAADSGDGTRLARNTTSDAGRWSDYPPTKTPDPFPGMESRSTATSGTRLASNASTSTATAFDRAAGTQQGFYNEPADDSAASSATAGTHASSQATASSAPPFLPPGTSPVNADDGFAGPPPFQPPAYAPQGTTANNSVPPTSTVNNFGTLPPPPGPTQDNAWANHPATSAQPAASADRTTVADASAFPRVPNTPSAPSATGQAAPSTGVVATPGAPGTVAAGSAGGPAAAASSFAAPEQTINPFVTGPAAAPAASWAQQPGASTPPVPPSGMAPNWSPTGGESPSPIPAPAARTAEPWRPGSTGGSVAPASSAVPASSGATAPAGSAAAGASVPPSRLSQPAGKAPLTNLAISDDFPRQLWR